MKKLMKLSIFILCSIIWAHSAIGQTWAAIVAITDLIEKPSGICVVKVEPFTIDGVEVEFTFTGDCDDYSVVYAGIEEGDLVTNSIITDEYPSTPDYFYKGTINGGYKFRIKSEQDIFDIGKELLIHPFEQ